jgi:recombination protein RecR
MQTNNTLENLIESLKCLPGVGPKSALRLAYYLLQRDRQGAHNLAKSIDESLNKLGHCQLCNNFSEEDTCKICDSQDRITDTLCVVEMPTDLLMLEQTHSYKGMYFVLMGRLSPLDGIGPKEIHINKLLERIKQSEINEVILATNFTTEGNTTAQYIAELLKETKIKVTRIARGLPMGGEIEYVDSGTLAQSLVERKKLI